MRIKDLAENAGVSVDTIRHYERAGLLAPTARQANNYRRYDASALSRLVFIRNARALDMSLDEIRDLLRCVARAGGDCHAADALLAKHAQHVRERWQALRDLEQRIESLRRTCRADDGAGLACPAMAQLGAAEAMVPHRGVHSV
jgi:DNA-binding transcriptional MerR regulator